MIEGTMDDAASRAWRQENGIRPPEDDLECPHCGRVVYCDFSTDPQHALELHQALSRECVRRGP